MPDPQTPNLGLFVPLRGADVGTWDTPVNTNFNVLDSIAGTVSNVAVTNANVTLSPAQYQANVIVVTGNNSADLILTVPSVGRTYTFINAVTNQAFIVGVNCGGGQLIYLPPGTSQVAADGTNMFFLNNGIVGSFHFMAVTVVPRWISQCSVPPFLNCDGSSFSAVTYPALASYLATTTLPDFRGRAYYTLNQGTGRLSGAINGGVIFSAGGSVNITQANLPSYTLPDTLGTSINDPGHAHGTNESPHSHGLSGTLQLKNTTNGTAIGFNYIDGGSGYGGGTNGATTGLSVNTNTTGITTTKTGSVTSGGSNSAYAPPGCVGGFTFIKAI